MQYGVSKSKNFNKNQIALHQFLIPLEIIDFDYNASVEYGKIRYELEKVGTPIGPLDLKRQGVFFCFYQYYVPNGTVPEGQNIGSMQVVCRSISPVEDEISICRTLLLIYRKLFSTLHLIPYH